MVDVKILLVEDESIEALDIKRTLESFGYEVPYVASSSEEAVEKTLEIMPDLILMDIILKGELDGIETVSKIKDLNIPVIYLTAHSEESTIERAKLTEPYGYIIKPYDRTELKYAIKLAIYKNQMEKELKESEKKFYLLFENSPLPYQSLDENGFLLDINPAWLDILGYSKDEVIGKNFADFLAPGYTEHFKKNFPHFKNAGEIHEVEFEMKRKDGSNINVSYEGKIGYDELGNFKQTHCIFHNITQQKKAEKALKESEEKFRAIAGNAIDAILIAVEKGKHVYVNPKAVELTGYSKEELLNTQIEDIAHPDEIVNLKKRYDQRIAGKHIPATYETRIVRKDNQIVPIEISAARTIWKDQPAVMVQVRDITKRKKAELSLKKSAERFRAVAESAIDAIVTTDENGKIIFFNNSLTKIFGYTKEEITGKPLTILMPTRYQKNYLIALQNFKESGKHRIIGKTMTTIGLKKDKSEFPFEMSLSTWKSEQKTYFTSIIRDLSERKKAEKELLESEGLLRGLFDNMPSGMSVYQVQNDGSNGSDYIIKEFNLASQKIEGMKREDIIGKSLKDIRPKIDEYGLIPIFKNVWETGEPIHYPSKIYVDEEYTNWYENYVFKTPSGEVVAIYNDVTEQEKAKEVLKESEEKFRTVADYNYDWEYWISPDGDLLYVSPSCERITGYLPDEFIKEPTLLGKIIHPHDIEIREHLQNESKGQKRHDVIEYRIITKQGEERWIAHGCQPVYNNEGEFIGRRASNRDITKRKKSELKLKESEEQINAIFNTVYSGIIMVNTEGFINFANQYMTEMFGFKLQELIGMPYFDLTANKERTAAETNLVNLIKGEIDHTFVERQYQRNDGSVFWGNLSGTRILNEDGSLKGLIGVITDITDHKMDADALKESLNEKDTLLREIHHRVKNNMQIISSLLNLQMHHEDLDETVNVLKESQGRVKSMAMIHEKLYQSPNFTDINFKDYIDKLIFDIFYSYGIKIGTIESVLDIEDINLNIETAIPLGLIVNELVTNSVKYAFPKGEGIITIHLKSLQDKMELTITDNGIGLPKDIDIDNTETLGLQLVKSLVNQIEGKIELDQTHGTEFKIIYKELEYKERI